MNLTNRNLKYEDLRQWIGIRRKYLIERRDNADTQEGRFIFIGQLRGLNELESELNQVTTFVDFPLKPTKFPENSDQIGAILLEEFNLPKTLHLNDLSNQQYLYKVIHNWQDKQNQILLLNRLVKNRQLIDEILKVLIRKMGNGALVRGPEPELKKEVIVENPPKEIEEIEGKRGRLEGTTFEIGFECVCGKKFKYEKAFENHKESCESWKASLSDKESKRGRMEGETFQVSFKCEKCGKEFKYKKAFENHIKDCQG